MDRIKKIKIKQQDGTMSDYYSIGADASNVNINYNNSTATFAINPNTTLIRNRYLHVEDTIPRIYRNNS